MIADPVSLYCTVNITGFCVDCESVPEVAVIVNCDVPVGVPFIALAQPARTTPLTSSNVSGTMAAYLLSRGVLRIKRAAYKPASKAAIQVTSSMRSIGVSG